MDSKRKSDQEKLRNIAGRSLVSAKNNLMDKTMHASITLQKALEAIDTILEIYHKKIGKMQLLESNFDNVIEQISNLFFELTKEDKHMLDEALGYMQASLHNIPLKTMATLLTLRSQLVEDHYKKMPEEEATKHRKKASEHINQADRYATTLVKHEYHSDSIDQASFFKKHEESTVEATPIEAIQSALFALDMIVSIYLKNPSNEDTTLNINFLLQAPLAQADIKILYEIKDQLKESLPPLQDRMHRQTLEKDFQGLHTNYRLFQKADEILTSLEKMDNENNSAFRPFKRR